jgi:H+/Cl- antiporter ClcA
VTLAAIVVWLVAWLALARRWRHRDVSLRLVNLAAMAMLVAALLLTFPPMMDLLQGR